MNGSGHLRTNAPVITKKDRTIKAITEGGIPGSPDGATTGCNMAKTHSAVATTRRKAVVDVVHQSGAMGLYGSR